MKAFSSKLGDLIAELGTDKALGLTNAQVSERLEKFGQNKLEEQKKKSTLRRFFEQFLDVMILILLAAAAISFVVAIRSGEAHELFEPLLILLIVVINAVMGVVQESKAEKSLEALKSLSSPHARVIRDGAEQIIDAAMLVPGDIIKIEAGDFVPADCRIIEAFSLKCEESALTGESVPSEKNADVELDDDAPLGDRANMIYSGCAVSYGSATAVVCDTGMNTEMGKIAKLLAGAGDEKTPLQVKLAKLGTYLGIVALAACAVIFAVGLVSGMDILDIFMISVSLAVSAIPEGLPAIVTIVLSIGVTRMVKKNAIIRRLPAVETLGGASIICSDKTGTLTQNRMTLTKIFCEGSDVAEEVSGGGESDAAKELLRLATLCCDGSVVVNDDGSCTHIGDPTETSIVYAAMKCGFDKDVINAETPRVASIPFDSDRKLMTSINVIDGKMTVIVKGAFDMLAERCISGDIEKARSINEGMAKNALRVIAVAYKTIDAVPEELTSEAVENGLNFIGLVGMIDPPREEAKDAVAKCRRAGIKPVMITGDHVVTASAIARALDIMRDGDEAVTGAELDAMSDEELIKRIRNISVYARVSPENKIRIVKAWQSLGQTVAMTGDGVNDAPALKAADIGCAMGITGTDVAKGAADMTLTDDNFATIVEAVRQGRGIYANIRKVVSFLLGTNIGEVLTVFAAMMIWRESPFLSMQLLMINLVTDSLPAIALGMEDVEPDVMDAAPRAKNEGIFANGLGLRIVLQGVMFAVLTLGAFAIGRFAIGSFEAGSTLAFFVLAFSQIIQSFCLRSDRSLFRIGFFSNKTLNLAALASVLLTAAVLFLPGVQTVFGLVYLPVWAYLCGLALVLVPLAVMEFAKAVGLIRHGK
ncbi:MAG: cation-translocating P-type ATPase [Clostridia bacterium]|nr:cation-translocating P-type ATPase [Clostridia bacterium]